MSGSENTESMETTEAALVVDGVGEPRISPFQGAILVRISRGAIRGRDM
jgi:hypothetical protein